MAAQLAAYREGLSTVKVVVFSSEYYSGQSPETH
jgi:hypothetical protein